MSGRRLGVRSSGIRLRLTLGLRVLGGLLGRLDGAFSSRARVGDLRLCPRLGRVDQCSGLGDGVGAWLRCGRSSLGHDGWDGWDGRQRRRRCRIADHDGGRAFAFTDYHVAAGVLHASVGGHRNGVAGDNGGCWGINRGDGRGRKGQHPKQAK